MPDRPGYTDLPWFFPVKQRKSTETGEPGAASTTRLSRESLPCPAVAAGRAPCPAVCLETAVASPPRPRPALVCGAARGGPPGREGQVCRRGAAYWKNRVRRRLRARARAMIGEGCVSDRAGRGAVRSRRGGKKKAAFSTRPVARASKAAPHAPKKLPGADRLSDRHRALLRTVRIAPSCPQQDNNAALRQNQGCRYVIFMTLPVARAGLTRHAGSPARCVSGSGRAPEPQITARRPDTCVVAAISASARARSRAISARAWVSGRPAGRSAAISDRARSRAASQAPLRPALS